MCSRAYFSRAKKVACVNKQLMVYTMWQLLLFGEKSEWILFAVFTKSIYVHTLIIIFYHLPICSWLGLCEFNVWLLMTRADMNVKQLLILHNLLLLDLKLWVSSLFTMRNFQSKRCKNLFIYAITIVNQYFRDFLK